MTAGDPPIKRSLGHLPKAKQEELEVIVRMIREAVDVEMIILFGSYARGDWVEEENERGEWRYLSDFDLLVVVDDRKLARKRKVWDRMEAALYRRSAVRRPVSLVTENIHGLNERLQRGHYFYADIKREGVLLYDSGQHTLAAAGAWDPLERRRQAEADFAYWFQSADSFLTDFRACLERGDLAKGAFELHQATERFYAAILLVFTGYKPRTHDLEDLGKGVAAQEPGFLRVFPQGTEEERRLFTLLRRAYVEARYDKAYRISRAELEWLEGRIALLRRWSERRCRERIEGLIEEAVRPDAQA